MAQGFLGAIVRVSLGTHIFLYSIFYSAQPGIFEKPTSITKTVQLPPNGSSSPLPAQSGPESDKTCSEGPGLRIYAKMEDGTEQDGRKGLSAEYLPQQIVGNETL